MISIVTITFNNYDELRATLDSVVGLDHAESVVINGGTCPETLNFLETSPIKHLSERDHGISDAFNKGIKLSSGDAIMFLNSGDILLKKDYIPWASRMFQENPEIDFCYSGIIYSDIETGPREIRPNDAENRSLARGLPYPHQTMIIRKSVFEQVGHFDLSFRYAMDFDLILRMKRFGLKGRYYDDLTVQMDGSGVSSKNRFGVLRETQRALGKNGFLSIPVGLRLGLSYLNATVKHLLKG